MAGAKIKITAADSKFHCTKFIDADVTGIQMKADGTVTANGINEVKSKNTRFMQGGELQTPELVEDGAEN